MLKRGDVWSSPPVDIVLYSGVEFESPSIESVLMMTEIAGKIFTSHSYCYPPLLWFFMCFIRKNILLYRLPCTWIIVETLTFLNAESNMYKIHVELIVTLVINFIQPFISCVLNMIPKLVVSFSLVDWWASFVLYYEYTCWPVQVIKFCYGCFWDAIQN